MVPKHYSDNLNADVYDCTLSYICLIYTNFEVGITKRKAPLSWDLDIKKPPGTSAPGGKKPKIN